MFIIMENVSKFKEHFEFGFGNPSTGTKDAAENPGTNKERSKTKKDKMDESLRDMVWTIWN